MCSSFGTAVFPGRSAGVTPGPRLQSTSPCSVGGAPSLPVSCRRCRTGRNMERAISHPACGSSIACSVRLIQTPGTPEKIAVLLLVAGFAPQRRQPVVVFAAAYAEVVVMAVLALPWAVARRWQFTQRLWVRTVPSFCRKYRGASSGSFSAGRLLRRPLPAAPRKRIPTLSAKPGRKRCRTGSFFHVNRF